MNNAVTEFCRSFKVSKFRVTLVCTLVAGKPIGLRFEWSPYYPSGLSGQAFRQYRRKRDICLKALTGCASYAERRYRVAVYPPAAIFLAWINRVIPIGIDQAVGYLQNATHSPDCPRLQDRCAASGFIQPLLPAVIGPAVVTRPHFP